MNREQARERMTARALGELTDAECAELDQVLADDAELQREADELSSLNTLLTQALRTAPEKELTGLQRARILWHGWRPFGRAKGVLVMPLATAACLLLVWLTQEGDVAQVVAPPLPTTVALSTDDDSWGSSESAKAEEPAPALNSPDRTRKVLRPRAGLGGNKPDSALRERDLPEAQGLTEPSVVPEIDYQRFEGSPEKRVERSNRWNDSRPGPTVAARPNFAARPAPRKPTQPRVAKRPRRRAQNYDRFLSADAAPSSTFSVDVDTASYARMRQAVHQGQLPSVETRIEELVNYFQYDYPKPTGDHPISITVDAAQAPWARQRGLVRVGLRAVTPPPNDRGSNLVFLIDVSGSMQSDDKLPLLKRALTVLVGELKEDDWVSIVVYAGRTAVLLEPTSASDERTIRNTIDALTAQGSTDGGSGIELAYEMAQEHFISGGVNRVFLATDGDFNVGISRPDELERFIQDKALSGVFLSVLGFGDSRDGDQRLERLAGKGNGNYAHIDGEAEAHRVLSEQLRSTMSVVAKDVKLQVEFNPETVESYRLLGYDNRRLRRRDFEDDTKDAGDVGAGHRVTAFYEVLPVVGARRDRLMTVKVRYKAPESSGSVLLEQSVPNRFGGFNSASDDFRFGAAVAGFGMLLRGYDEAGTLSFADVESWARAARGRWDRGERSEFVRLVGRVQELEQANERRWSEPADDVGPWDVGPWDRGPRRRNDCLPPYYMDNGIKKLKPECLR